MSLGLRPISLPSDILIHPAIWPQHMGRKLGAVQCTCLLYTSDAADDLLCVDLGPGNIVLDGDQALPPPKVHSLQFSAHMCCGQMAGWIKMPLGREIGLSPSDIVLDGDPAPPRPKGSEPQFSCHVYCGKTARWIKMALGTEVGLGSAQRRCVR